MFFAHKNARAGGPVLWTAPCSGTFLVTGNVAVVEALGNAARGGPARILGSVRRSADYRAVAGANVVVRSETNRYVVSTDRDGRYEIRGVVPGSYRIEVTQPGYERDPTYKKFSAVAALNPDDTTAEVREGTCAMVETGLLEDGKISGTVSDQDGVALGGVEVQAFDAEKVRREPVRKATTDASGRYVLGQLASGKYVVGVNARENRDEGPYRRTLFKGAVTVGTGLSAGNVDLKLAEKEKRVAAALRITVLGEDGQPVSGATVRLLSLQGVERRDGGTGPLATENVEFAAYAGEWYVVEAVRGSLKGQSSVQVVPGRNSVTVVLKDKLQR